MYTNLKTRPIKVSPNKCPNMKQKITSTLNECFKTKAFSTFPYIMDDYNSKQAINKTNSGNCISLSLFVKQKLKEKYGITSHLIPASVPSFIHRDGYLDISHVALAVPIHNDNQYIIDPAFYFLEPILVKKNKMKPIMSVNIMDDALSSITPSLHTLDAPLILNEYQRFPKNTHYCQCYFDEHNDDPWNYYLREITNPDEAITSTFISVRPNPFFTSTKLDDGQWKKDLIITTHNNNTISIKNNNSSIYNGDRFTIPDTIKALVESMLVERGFDKNILV
jgi:hypothetical protein